MAYLGFHFGGVQNISGKVGVFVWGFGGMLPREHFKKWCNLVRFREYFAEILSKKKIDNVLLRTISLEVLQHTPHISCHLCDLVCFGVQFLELSLKKIL